MYLHKVGKYRSTRRNNKSEGSPAYHPQFSTSGVPSCQAAQAIPAGNYVVVDIILLESWARWPVSVKSWRLAVKRLDQK